MPLSDLVRLVRKGWIVMVVGALLGIGAAAALSLTAERQFVATTQLFVSVTASEQSTATDLVQGSSAAQQKVKSYVDIVRSSKVLAPVAAELPGAATVSGLASQVSADNPLNTVLINLSVRDTSPARAAAIANAVGKSLTDAVSELETPESGGSSLVKVETLEPATAPSTAASPNVTRNLGLGFLIGLALGVAVSVARQVLDTRIHGSADILELTDVPIVGGIGFDTGVKARPLVVHADPRNPRAEAFRTLRTNVKFLGVGGSSRRFVVTSSLPGEGKTTTSANLALALAESGSSVVVVDGDLRLPRLSEVLEIDGAVGLTDVLIGRAELSDVLQPWGRNRLAVLPAGVVPPNPSELLGSVAMADLLAQLGEAFDYVVLDAPPLLPVTDAAVIAQMTDGALVVAAASRTRKPELRAALASLTRTGSRTLGVILTMVPTTGPDASGYGAYGKYYGMTQDDPSSDFTRRSAPRLVRSSDSAV